MSESREDLERELRELEKEEMNLKNSSSGKSSIPRETTKAIRKVISMPGMVADFPITAINSALGGFGSKKRIPSQQKASENLFDYMTSNYARPETDQEKIHDAALDVLAPSIANKAKYLQKGASYAAKGIKEFLKPTTTGVIGAAAGQHFLNKDPESSGKALIASLLPGVVKGGATASIKKLTPGVKEHFSLSQLKQNKNVQKNVEDEIGRMQGSLAIEPMGHEATGKRGILSANRMNKKFKSYFGDKYKSIDDYVNKYTDFNTNEKRFIDVSDGVDWIADHYKNLDQPALKKEFLQSKTGENLRRLLNVPKSSNIDDDMKIVDLLIKHKPEIPRVSYNDARQLQRNIQNTLSKAGEVGTKEQGQLRKVSEKLNNNMSQIFRDDPQMEKLWRTTNDEYIGYLEHRKPKINEILKFKGSHKHEGKAYPGNPTGAFHTIEKNISENPDYLDFILEGMKPDTRDSFVRGLIRNYGKEGEKYNPLKGAKAISNLEKPVKERLMGGLKKQTRKQFEEPTELLKQYKHEIHQPHTESALSPLFDKALSAVPGAIVGGIAGGPPGALAGSMASIYGKNALYKKITPSTTENAIKALERRMGKKTISKEPEVMTESLKAVRPGLTISQHSQHKIPVYTMGEKNPERIEYRDIDNAQNSNSKEELEAELRALEAEEKALNLKS